MGLFLVGAALGQEDAVKKELAKLQGVWKIVRGEEDGEPLSEQLVQNLKLVFKGDQLTLKEDEGVAQKAAKVALKIDPSTTPKCIDFKIEAGTKKDTFLEGIYEW